MIILRILNISLTMLIISSCASTKIVESWKEQGKQITMDKLKKVLV